MTSGERSIPDCHGAVCVTCADEAVAMRVLRVDGGGLAECAEGDGATHMVETALAGEIAVGDANERGIGQLGQDPGVGLADHADTHDAHSQRRIAFHSVVSQEIRSMAQIAVRCLG